MSERNKSRLVVDASVAKGSNDRMFNPMSDLPGDLNRQCLIAIREEKHVAVFNSQLEVEWSNHASPFAKRWLGDMVGKEKVLQEEGEQFRELESPARAALGSDEERNALSKDFHLVRSAMATDRIIVSNERRFPAFLVRASEAVIELRELHYASPLHDGDACRLWIKSGARRVAIRKVAAWIAKGGSSD